MKLLLRKTVVLFSIIVIASLALGGCGGRPPDKSEGETRVIIDGRGVEVRLPERIDRVVTISDGLVEGVMKILGVQDRIVGLGCLCLQKDFNYNFDTGDGTNREFVAGTNTITRLCPRLRGLPLVAEMATGINYEALAATEPDLVIVRLGDCTMGTEEERIQKSTRMVASLGIPVVVLLAPRLHGKPDMRSISGEIRIIGSIFAEEEKAEKTASFLEDHVRWIRERTRDIAERDKPEVMVFGLSPLAREKGGAGNVLGMDNLESYFIEEIVNARNAFRDPGVYRILSAEQVLAIDPDVIILSTSNGYHPPAELYGAPYFQHLQDLSALRNRRVSALPFSPRNCDKRLEYPIDVMIIAKAAYPDLFSDVDLGEWLLEFYMGLYGIDEETARDLRSCQWLGWTVEEK